MPDQATPDQLLNDLRGVSDTAYGRLFQRLHFLCCAGSFPTEWLDAFHPQAMIHEVREQEFAIGELKAERDDAKKNQSALQKRVVFLESALKKNKHDPDEMLKLRRASSERAKENRQLCAVVALHQAGQHDRASALFEAKPTQPQTKGEA